MILKGIRNQQIEFQILGYELPENFGPSYESNFLYLNLNIESEFGNWQTDSCALSTTDVEKIIDWFYNLAQNTITKPQLCFKDKDISFKRIKKNTRVTNVRIHFHSECTPDNSETGKPYYVDLELNNLQLIEVSENFQTELNPFPSRGFEE